MFRVAMQHGGIRPAGDALFRENGRNRLTFRLQTVGLIGPGAGGHDAFVFKIAHLYGGIVPVAMNQGVLIAQHLEYRLILRFGKLIGVTDTQLRLGGFDEQRGIGNINRPVIGLHAAQVGFTVRQVLFDEHHAPAVRRRREGFRVVH